MKPSDWHRPNCGVPVPYLFYPKSRSFCGDESVICCGRYYLGQGITKKENDLAADVEEQQQALKAKAAEKKEQEAAVPEPQQNQQPAVKVPLSNCMPGVSQLPLLEACCCFPRFLLLACDIRLQQYHIQCSACL